MQETDCVLVKGIDYSKQEPFISIKGVAEVKPLLDFNHTNCLELAQKSMIYQDANLLSQIMASDGLNQNMLLVSYVLRGFINLIRIQG